MRQPSAPVRRRRPVILGAAALAVVVLGGCSLLPGKAEPAASPSASASEDPLIPGLSGGELTEASVKGLDPREVYLASLRQQTLQPTINVKQEVYERKAFYPGGSRMAVTSGVDYRSKRVRMEKAQIIARDGKEQVSYGVRCAGEEEKFWSSAEDGWETRSTSECPSLASMAWLNDGLATGGMNAAQSEEFMRYLSGIEGLINGQSISLAGHRGRPYLRVVIRVKQVDLDGLYAGAGLYGDAVKSADLDWATHPYGNLFHDGDLRIVRYVDPKTALPAYAETIETSALARNGKPVDPNAWEMHRVEYAFNGPVATSTLPRTPEIIRLSWRPER